MLASRLFLADPESLDRLKAGDFISYEKDRFTETFLDTAGSSLSNAECILKCDSTAPWYWKFFCYAEDNIMEITTDEKDIREPLSRLSHFHSPDTITRDLLQPFFRINNTLEAYLVDGCLVEVGKTDFGFAFAKVSHFFIHDIAAAISAINFVTTELGFKSLALYEPLDFIFEKSEKSKK